MTGWLETIYSTQKFPDESQYPYWEQGVNRGDFSFAVSILNYLNRARLFVQEIHDENNPLGLQVTQSLGKSAHNTIALAAVAQTYQHRRPLLVVHNEIAAGINNRLDETLPINQTCLDDAYEHRQTSLEALQVAQDSGNIGTFRQTLSLEMIAASSLFVSAAKRYGYPAPGRSSGDITAW
ncbi:MAG TPA: hypothetical protein PLT04_00735 [Candidatus Saccharibacteria bacterium]|nr:hypothetical protein [Candidatus Saccharibacteria bacterium]